MKAYQLKASIKDTHPPVWRRFIVPAGLSFAQFTVVLNTAIGWSGENRNSYIFNRFYEQVEDMEYLYGISMDFERLNGRAPVDQDAVIIDEYFDKVQSFTYIYDFEDNWNHQIQIEKTFEDYENSYPAVLRYQGETPWEDCGGLAVYNIYQNVLNDPEDERYGKIRKMADEDYSEAYDIDSVNAKLARMVLTDNPGVPVSLHDLMQRIEDGHFAFDRIRIPDPADEFQWEQNNEEMWNAIENEIKYGGMPYDGDSSIDEMMAEIFANTGHMILQTYADVIYKLEKNTSLGRSKIVRALELDQLESESGANGLVDDILAMADMIANEEAGFLDLEAFTIDDTSEGANASKAKKKGTPNRFPKSPADENAERPADMSNVISLADIKKKKQ